MLFSAAQPWEVAAALLEGEVEMSAAHVWQESGWRPDKFSNFYDSFLSFLKETVPLLLAAYEVSGRVRTPPPLKKTLEYVLIYFLLEKHVGCATFQT